MSSDFYFKKWKQTLVELMAVVRLDVEFQETKAHDKKLCEASQRLSGVLGRYMAVYNNIWECLHQNLQVQKTSYIHDVLKAVVSRILELKHELRKLEVSEHNFSSNGLMHHKLTPDDAELKELPDKVERPKNINALLKDIFEQVKERKRLLEEAANAGSTEHVQIDNWWDRENVEEEEESTDEKKVELTEDQVNIKKNIELIQAQERTRQVITEIVQQRNKRERWEKELKGILVPMAPFKIRENGAKLIQKVLREYFKLKRQKILLCKKDQMIGLRPCLKPKMESKETSEQVKEQRIQFKRKYDEECKTEFEDLKEDYLRRKGDDIKEDYRDHIRDWFKIWFETIKFFHDLPGERQGGAALIFNEELPTPEEWLEEYNAYLAEKTANKNKTAMDLKFAKMEAKREEMELKKEALMKKKLEEELRRKMMKNPTMHPGFDYPESKKTEHIFEVVNNYYRDWNELDATESLDVKEKSVRDVNMSNAYMEAKLELISTVEEDMRNELKLLKQALKIDYENNEEKMPEPQKPKNKKGKRKPIIKKTLSANITDQLEDLVFRGYLKEYPKTKIEEFIGDPNFTGDDMRCNYLSALPHNGEVRNIWWEKCRELDHGFHKILLVGPQSSGKTTLVNVLASMNDAALFELDPSTIPEVFVAGVFLAQLVHSVAVCARAVQPAVIHIKHVNKLFYRKVPPVDSNVDWKLLQRYFVKKLLNSIHKTDKITVVGTCVDPWLAKSNPLLKQFPTVVLLPTTSYGTVVQILKDWIINHPMIPTDFEVSNLAYVLQGYNFGFLKNALEKFLSADTIIRIAARGISPLDVYNFILDEETEEKIDYTKYLQWYSDKTAWGKKEQKHLKEQNEFKQAMDDFAERMAKKKQKSGASTPTQNSYTS